MMIRICADILSISGGVRAIFTKDTPCPITTLLDVISAKWVIEIMRELAIKPTRTTEFLTHIPGLSMKILRERLQMLEEARLILRTERPGRPLYVEHSITERGKQVLYILMDLKRLASEWANESCSCSIETLCTGEGVLDCPRRRARVRSYTTES